MADRQNGVVIWYKPESKFGFLKTHIEGWLEDVFVHASALPKGVVLKPGDEVTFELGGIDDRYRAERVELVEAPAEAD